MPTSILKISPRKIFLEDLSVSTENDPDTIDTEVMGVGEVPLTPISVVLYSTFHPYADDTAAAAGGVPVGGHYFSTTYSTLHTRMT